MNNTHCGHDPHYIVSAEDGTQYCEACEQEASKMNQEDALTPSEIEAYKNTLLSSENANELARIGLRLVDECIAFRSAFDVLEAIRTNLEEENFGQRKALMQAVIDIAKMRQALSDYANESNWTSASDYDTADAIFVSPIKSQFQMDGWQIAQDVLEAVDTPREDE